MGQGSQIRLLVTLFSNPIQTPTQKRDRERQKKQKEKKRKKKEAIPDGWIWFGRLVQTKSLELRTKLARPFHAVSLPLSLSLSLSPSFRELCNFSFPYFFLSFFFFFGVM